MAKKRKLKKAMPNAKAIEKRLQRYGEGTGRDKFGKKTNQQDVQTAKVVPLMEMKGD